MGASFCEMKESRPLVPHAAALEGDNAEQTSTWCSQASQSGPVLSDIMVFVLISTTFLLKRYRKDVFPWSRVVYLKLLLCG